MNDPPLRPDQPATDHLTERASFRWALRALVVLPIVVAAARAVATGWFPVGDSALLAIRAYDVGTGQHPLLGSWTSASLTLGEDVNNPGPLYPDLLAPFMWTFGRWFSIGTGIAIGVAAVNAVFAMATALVGHRLGGWRVERWALLLVAALTWSMGSELLIDIWQPHALLLPFTCLLLVTVALIVGDWALTPLWLGVTSLIVQTHIGYVYVLAVLGVLVLGHGAAALRHLESSPSEVLTGRTARWSLGVVVLAWIQPLIEQVAGEGRGNLLRLATNASGGDVTIGGGTAVKLVAQVVGRPPWWTRPGFDDTVVSTPLTDGPDGPRLVVPGLPSGPVAALIVAALVVGLVVLAVLLRRRGPTVAGAAVLVSTVGLVTAVATLMIQTVSVVGLGSHHVRWLFALALFVHVSIIWALIELGVGRLAPRLVDIGVPTLVAVFAVLNLGFLAHDLGPTADREAADTLERTFDDLDDFEPGGPVRYDVSDIRPFEPWSAAVKMGLVERGIEVRVADEGVVRQLGNGRRADGTEAAVIRQIERSTALTVDEPCVISAASPFAPAESARLRALVDAAVDDVAAGVVELDTDGLDGDLASRFAAATGSDRAEAFTLVADGVLGFMADDGRIVRSSAAVDALLAERRRVDRFVRGFLVLVAEPTDPAASC